MSTFVLCNVCAHLTPTNSCFEQLFFEEEMLWAIALCILACNVQGINEKLSRIRGFPRGPMEWRWRAPIKNYIQFANKVMPYLKNPVLSHVQLVVLMHRPIVSGKKKLSHSHTMILFTCRRGKFRKIFK